MSPPKPNTDRKGESAVEENFEPVARTRANYYTPGSPVQFVCVELLKGESSGELAVCLTFKNISKVVLTALEIHFKCKGVDGVLLCEDVFEYRDLSVQPGESFGMDDAVFVTQKAITSVDVALKNVYNGKRVVHLDGIKRVRLPAPRRLSPELQKLLEARMNREGMKYMPQVFENGWYCACGAFHPKEEDTVYCSECGCDRILLQNAMNTLLQPEQRKPAPAAAETPAAPPEKAAPAEKPAAAPEEPTRVMDNVRTERPQPVHEGSGLRKPASFAPPIETAQPLEEQTRVLDARASQQPARAWNAPADAEGTRVVPTPQRPVRQQPEEDDTEEERDGIAETLIRWVPPITAIVCAGIALWGFVYYQFMM